MIAATELNAKTEFHDDDDDDDDDNDDRISSPQQLA